MKINANNYEAYFLDYIEGRLDELSITELKTFLSKNPQFNIENEQFDYLLPEKIEFSNKSFLKKLEFQTCEVNHNNFEEFCIAWFEQLLSKEKAKELFVYLDSNPQYYKVFHLYEKTYLKAPFIAWDKKILYRKKHSKVVYKSAAFWFSIAAGIAILIMVSSEIRNKNSLVSNTLTSKYKVDLPSSSKVISSPIAHTVVQNNKLYSVNEFKSNNLNHVNGINTLIKDSLKPERISFILPIELAAIKSNNNDNIPISLNKVYDLSNNQQKIKLLVSIGNFTKRITNFDRVKNRNGTLSLFKVALIGINGINQITNSHMKLTEKTDTSGNVKVFSFESGLFEYHKINGN
jgi:hypothetical protein